MVKTKKDDSKRVEEVTQNLLNFIGVKAGIDISDTDDGYTVNIDAGEESGLIIGNRGRTLISLQHILSMMVNKQNKEWKRVNVDVASWRAKEDERLMELAAQTAERARTSGAPQNLYNLTPQQRRTIHMALSKEKDVVTESFGEGKDRYLVVTSKK